MRHRTRAAVGSTLPQLNQAEVRRQCYVQHTPADADRDQVSRLLPVMRRVITLIVVGGYFLRHIETRRALESRGGGNTAVVLILIKLKLRENNNGRIKAVELFRE